MSKVNYKILAFDDINFEYVVLANDKKFNVPAVVTDGLVDKDETTKVTDLWTFEKIIGSKNPTWILSEVTAE